MAKQSNMTTTMEMEQLDSAVQGWTCLRVSGEVDMQSAPSLKEGLAAAIGSGATALLVDLRDVDFMDSSGLGALVSGMKRAQEIRGRFGLICADGPVRKVLAITRLDRAFELYDSLESVPELSS